jgi:molybdate transport system permease protein
MDQQAPQEVGAEEAPRGRLLADSSLIRRALAGTGVFAATAVALGFLLLPIVAIFARVSPGELVAQLSQPVVTDALVLSLKTSAIAQALVVLVGTPAAYVLATRRFPGRSLAVVLVELPLVLPPAVAGIGLIAAFGRLGLLGGTLDAFGVRLGLTQAAVVIAVAYVSSPFYVRQAIAAFEAVDPNLVAASRTLGAGRARTFFRVVLPLARRGLAAGEALSFARGLGEFGATIMFAGSLQGATQTLPLAIYSEFNVQPNGFTTALAMSALLVVVSGALLVALRITLQWQPSKPTSRFLFAPSR